MTLKWKRAKKTERTNERKQSDLIGLSNGSKRSSEKLHARELSRNKLILRFDVTVQHDWPIEQCLLHIRVFFSGKTKRSCFDLFVHWLIKQITNTYRNHGRDPFNQNFRKFRSKTQWIGSVQPEKFRKNGSTF